MQQKDFDLCMSVADGIFGKPTREYHENMQILLEEIITKPSDLYHAVKEAVRKATAYPLPVHILDQYHAAQMTKMFEEIEADEKKAEVRKNVEN